jgi:murein L,D-transpeptidase YafK
MGTGQFTRSFRSNALILRPSSRLNMAAAAALCALALSGCLAENIAWGPDGNRKHLRPVPAQTVALIEQKGMTKESPILLRIYKEEAELEIWKQTAQGRYEFLKKYPICKWSGELGPKIKQGDRQAPEGFYSIRPEQMNPHSSYHLAFNLGFPNEFDRAHDRTGAHLMVHGDCSSSGCYAMTDAQIAEIFALAREAFDGGQLAFQVQAFPFRMTKANLARHRNNPNQAFWRMLKEGNDHFEVTRQEPKIDVCAKRYIFNAVPNDPMKPFDPTRPCPAYHLQPEIAELLKGRQQADGNDLTALVNYSLPPAPVRTGNDGGSNAAFNGQNPQRAFRNEQDAKDEVTEAPQTAPANNLSINRLLGVQDQKQQQRAKLEEMKARQQQQKQPKQAPAARPQQNQNSANPELPGSAAPIRRANDGFSFSQQ